MSSEKIASVIAELKGDLCIVNHALKKINAEQDDVAELNQMVQRMGRGRDERAGAADDPCPDDKEVTTSER